MNDYEVSYLTLEIACDFNIQDEFLSHLQSDEK